MSNLKDMNFMLGSYGTRESEENSFARESETDLLSNIPQEGGNSNMEESRYMMNSNSAVESERTSENSCPSNGGPNSQMSRKIKTIKFL